MRHTFMRIHADTDPKHCLEYIEYGSNSDPNSKQLSYHFKTSGSFLICRSWECWLPDWAVSRPLPALWGLCRRGCSDWKPAIQVSLVRVDTILQIVDTDLDLYSDTDPTPFIWSINGSFKRSIPPNFSVKSKQVFHATELSPVAASSNSNKILIIYLFFFILAKYRTRKKCRIEPDLDSQHRF